ncbi:P2R1A-PPP2R2A-interacting phosphatase regulator 1-like isoform X6 [Brienomyrus brachyistius]|uniref:P2R1A-PPP2R2A-interacting phosphatase regulator 1-like isoform X6 n=1 Tax=Brienomyrus brachyistius TaxID=42636 RepID=UPI0020B2E897|nr:P2R1A-PPP2R2A-interacting phosphatase regulator 1-like isoform X6 [Brienomyrus brachyistius]
MERMEIDQCAGATVATGGGALRRSNSAPMITGVSDGMAVFSSAGYARCRRSSVSVNPSSPGLALPLSPFPTSIERPVPQRQDESMELSLRGNLRQSASPLVPLPPITHWHDHIDQGLHSLDSGVTPNSSPSPTRRFKKAALTTAVRWPVLTPLKRKGGVESDAPPKKLFVAGVTESPHVAGYTVSVSHPADSPQGDGSTSATTQGSPRSCHPNHPSL